MKPLTYQQNQDLLALARQGDRRTLVDALRVFCDGGSNQVYHLATAFQLCVDEAFRERVGTLLRTPCMLNDLCASIGVCRPVVGYILRILYTASNNERVLPVRKCLHCDREFIPNQINDKYHCSACGNAARKLEKKHDKAQAVVDAFKGAAAQVSSTCGSAATPIVSPAAVSPEPPKTHESRAVALIVQARQLYRDYARTNTPESRIRAIRTEGRIQECIHALSPAELDSLRSTYPEVEELVAVL